MLDRFLTGLSERFSVQKSGPEAILRSRRRIDPNSGKANEIKRIFLKGIA